MAYCADRTRRGSSVAWGAAVEPLDGIAMLVDEPVADDAEFCCAAGAGTEVPLDC